MRRLFSVLHGKTLNVGRVQTPNLKMLVDRGTAITSFKKEKYYVVRLSLGGAEASSERIRAADEAKTLKTACETSQAVCVSLIRKKKTEQPPCFAATCPLCRVRTLRRILPEHLAAKRYQTITPLSPLWSLRKQSL